jgi:hypothetical protein
MDFRKKFMVEPGSKVHLSKIDASYTGQHESHEKAAPEIHKHLQRMDKLQYLLYADGNQSLLVVLQALDAAGKDGVIIRPKRMGMSCWTRPLSVSISNSMGSRRLVPAFHPPCDARGAALRSAFPSARRSSAER